MRFLSILPFLLSETLFAGDFDRAKSDLFEAIQSINPERASQAAKRLSAFDDKRAVETLCKGDALVSSVSENLSNESERWNRQLADNAYDEKIKKWKGSIGKYKEAKQELAYIEDKISRLQGLRILLIATLASLTSDEAVRETLQRLKSPSWSVRELAARGLGGMKHPRVLPGLLEALVKEREATVAVALIGSISPRMTGREKEIIDVLVPRLKDPYRQIVVAAARVLGRTKSPTAIEPLIEALKDADGQAQIEVNKALIALTGVDKHGDPEAWKFWWSANREAVLAGTYKPSPAEQSGQEPAGTTTFYGIPVTSKRVVFVLDRSGSMAAKTSWKPEPDVPTGPDGGGPEKPKGSRRMDIARYELNKVLRQLPDGAAFNIVFYNDLVEVFSPTMVKLTKESRIRAAQFIDSVEPRNATDIYEALMKALALAMTPDRKLSKEGVDTIYLLSDGEPTAGVTNTDELRKKILAANAPCKVAIHVIALEPTPPSATFLRALAAENHGQYVTH